MTETQIPYGVKRRRLHLVKKDEADNERSPINQGRKPEQAMEKTLKAEIEVLQKTLREIQSLSNTLSPEEPIQLESRLADLESKIKDLRNFIGDHFIGGTNTE